MPRPYRRRDPDKATATAAEIAAREAERDARLDDRDATQRLLGEAPPARPMDFGYRSSAIARSASGRA